MTFHTQRPPHRRQYLRTTPADRALVHSLSVMGVSVRELCRRLGERFGLDKPLSRVSLYHHFGQDLVKGGRWADRKKRPRRQPVDTQIVARLLEQSRRLCRPERKEGR